MSIEKNISDLEKILSELENEDIDLEKAVKKYGEALKIASKTQIALNVIEQKVFLLQKEIVPLNHEKPKASS